jgi:hypothetical protein
MGRRGTEGGFYKPLLSCGGRGEGREKQGQKMKKATIELYHFCPLGQQKSPENTLRKPLLPTKTSILE